MRKGLRGLLASALMLSGLATTTPPRAAAAGKSYDAASAAHQGASRRAPGSNYTAPDKAKLKRLARRKLYNTSRKHSRATAKK